MIGTIAAALLLAGPGAKAGEVGLTDTEIMIGMVNAQTGPTAGLGKAVYAGARAAFDAINAKGGICGRRLHLVLDDDRYEPNKTVEATLKMLDETKVFCLCGFVGTPTSNAALPIVKDENVPFVGPFTGSVTLRKPVIHQVFNIRSSYGDETEEIVDRFTKDLHVSRVAVFYQDDGFGQAVLSGTEAALKRRGMEVVGKGTFQRNSLAVLSGLAEVIKSKPDLVVMVGPYAPVAEFVKQARQNGLKSHFATVSFVGTEALIKTAGANGEGIVVSQVMPSPNSNLPIVQEAKSALEKSGESLGYVSLEGYVSAAALGKALEMAGHELTREKLIQTLETFKDVDLGGLQLSFGPASHQGSARVYLTVLRGGKAVQVSSLK